MAATVQETKTKKPLWKRWWLWATVAVVIIAIATSGGADEAVDSSAASGQPSTAESAAPVAEEPAAEVPAAEGTTVVYTLESDAPQVSATYMTVDNGSIGQQQANGVAPPWTQTLQVEEAGMFDFQSFTLTGQMMPDMSNPTGAQGSTITCRIEVNGEVVAEQTSTGQFAIVTCNAS